MKIPQALALLAGLSLSQFAVAAYSTNFNSFTLNSDVAPQDNWMIDDPTDDASYVIGLGGAFGARSASLGFASPLLQNNVYLSHSAGIGGQSLVGAQFTTLFQIQDSDSGNGPGSEVRDTFGFRLENLVGSNLFSFILTPFDQDATPENDIGFHTYSVSTGAGAPTIVLPGVASQENFAYTLTVNFTASGINDVAFNGSVNGSGFSGILPGLGLETITELGAFWNTTNGAAAPGSNFLIFDNIGVVPEPSAALLGMVGAAFAFGRRRRA